MQSPAEIIPHTGGAIGYSWLMIALPLLGAAILLLGGRRTDRWGHLLGVAMSLGAFAVAVASFVELTGMAPGERRQLMAEFSGNIALCEITERLVLTQPFTDAPANRISSALEPAVRAMRADARIRTHVNGELRQEARVRDVVFSPEELVSYASAMVTLNPGDLILTGTPAGVAVARQDADGRRPWLRSGDVVEVEITGLGRQRNELV